MSRTMLIAASTLLLTIGSVHAADFNIKLQGGSTDSNASASANNNDDLSAVQAAQDSTAHAAAEKRDNSRTLYESRDAVQAEAKAENEPKLPVVTEGTHTHQLRKKPKVQAPKVDAKSSTNVDATAH